MHAYSQRGVGASAGAGSRAGQGDAGADRREGLGALLHTGQQQGLTCRTPATVSAPTCLIRVICASVRGMLSCIHGVNEFMFANRMK